METLFVVDDDITIREVFSALLTSKGYAVHSAGGGIECTELLRTITPDLVLLDIMMHPVDGWETLAAIRSNPHTSDIPVIMFSGKSPCREEVISYGGWIEDYLMKPVTMPVITAAISTVFDRCRSNAGMRQSYLEKGADPRVLDEFFQLRRFFFIRNKFSRDLFRDPDCLSSEDVQRRDRFE